MINADTKPSRKPSKVKAPVGRAKAPPRKESSKASPSVVARNEASPAAKRSSSIKLAMGALCLAIGVWSYWSTIGSLIQTWNVVPDYSHGYLVVPLALMFLWARRKSFPGLQSTSPLLGLAMLGIAIAIRLLGARYYYSFVDGWSIVFWVAAVVAVIGGRPLLMWSLPAIGFLVFMVPLPFRVETEMSGPLQRIATKLSTLTLQLLGQPAFSEGTTILLGEEKLFIAEACSGLRIFVSTVALTYAYLALIRRPWWEKLILVLAAIPIAIVSNVARIVATGLLYRLTTNESLRWAAHEYAGFAMILLAAALFWLVLWYLSKLIREEEVMDMASIVQRSQI